MARVGRRHATLGRIPRVPVNRDRRSGLDIELGGVCHPQIDRQMDLAGRLQFVDPIRANDLWAQSTDVSWTSRFESLS